MRCFKFSKVSFCVFLTVFAFLINVQAQKKNAAFRYYIRKSASPIEIDGKMNEPGWALADSTSEFYMTLPMDTSLANVRTQV
ncbi:MAG TPA: hypothetical protein VK616_16765, partial [Flavitalea sp.]|nr:hypothetical protein [Flavitalea sp.]